MCWVYLRLQFVIEACVPACVPFEDDLAGQLCMGYVYKLITDSECCHLCLLLMQDATWVTASNSIVCANADEVLLLLKSSDRIAHDICNAFDGCIDKADEPVNWVLVLKKQYDLKPDREFRCFVKDNDLVGMTASSVPNPTNQACMLRPLLANTQYLCRTL